MAKAWTWLGNVCLLVTAIAWVIAFNINMQMTTMLAKRVENFGSEVGLLQTQTLESKLQLFRTPDDKWIVTAVVTPQPGRNYLIHMNAASADPAVEEEIRQKQKKRIGELMDKLNKADEAALQKLHHDMGLKLPRDFCWPCQPEKFDPKPEPDPELNRPKKWPVFDRGRKPIA